MMLWLNRKMSLFLEDVTISATYFHVAQVDLKKMGCREKGMQQNVPLWQIWEINNIQTHIHVHCLLP